MARLRLGLVSDEFFEPGLGRLGGFGWAARSVARLFVGDPSLGVDVVQLTSELREREGARETTLHGARLLFREPSRLARLRTLRREKLDLLLMIDYNLGYRFFLRALPRTPVIVWARDPRPPDDLAFLATLRIPGDPTRPQGIDSRQGLSLAGSLRLSRLFGRPLLFAVTSQHLGAKLEAAYGVSPDEVTLLPNIIAEPRATPRSERPSVLFLARLDPYKRPWLFLELARRFPDVEFVMAGQPHFRGPGGFELHGLPPNVRAVGHVDGEAKSRLLGAAWLLVNTSIHEGLAVSFLEALAHETPVVASVDPDGVVSRFGRFVGRLPGDGLSGLPGFEQALSSLLGDRALRARLGAAGRDWVRLNHSRERFREAFFALAARAGLAPARA